MKSNLFKVKFRNNFFCENSLYIHTVAPIISSNAKWKQNGTTIAGGNGKGNKSNQLNLPGGVYVDDNQTVLIVDQMNSRIVE